MKGTHRKEPRSKRESRNNKIAVVQHPEIADRREPKETGPLVGKTENQKKYLNAMSSSTIVLGTGPAGVGKTYLAAAFAAQELMDKTISHIVVTRPAVEAGEEMGFLPGEIDEKFDPYLQPFKDVFYRRLGKSHTEALIKSGSIEAAPLAYMRGRTFRNAIVILDEAQNTTPEQMKMFLTRIGEGSTMIINGDIRQSDLRGDNGLSDALYRLQGIPGVRVIEFKRSDIVRHGIIQDILEAYED